MKYKVGDRVRIKSLDWYNENKDIIDEVACGNTNFIPDMVKYCEEIVTISSVLPTLEVYRIKEDGGMFNWTDEMIEGLIEESITLNGKEVMLKLADIELPSGTTNIWECPEGYQFVDENGNMINATKIVLEKKEKEYPKTYEECCRVIGFCSNTLKWDNPFSINRDTHPYIKHIDNLMESFCKLLICRDAYWKIAGEKMGLGKSWEPDWGKSACYTICCNTNRIVFGIDKFRNAVLAFPTKEMRDAFYENFKVEIEQCKELL